MKLGKVELRRRSEIMGMIQIFYFLTNSMIYTFFGNVVYLIGCYLIFSDKNIYEMGGI